MAKVSVPVKTYLTSTQFAQAVGVHPNTVRLWEKKGVLMPHHKTPFGNRMYTMEQVSAYLGEDNGSEGNK